MVGSVPSSNVVVMAIIEISVEKKKKFVGKDDGKPCPGPTGIGLCRYEYTNNAPLTFGNKTAVTRDT